jgi:hypothetical protein
LSFDFSEEPGKWDWTNREQLKKASCSDVRLRAIISQSGWGVKTAAPEQDVFEAGDEPRDSARKDAEERDPMLYWTHYYSKLLPEPSPPEGDGGAARQNTTLRPHRKVIRIILRQNGRSSNP